MAKTNKSVLKRIRVTKTGKILKHLPHQNHFSAKKSRSRQLANILAGKGIPHWLDVWGHDVNHDWPWWRQALPYYFGKLFG